MDDDRDDEGLEAMTILVLALVPPVLAVALVVMIWFTVRA